MRKDITVAAEARASRGKNEARRLRVAGSIPAVVYGAYQDAVAVAVSPKELSKILQQHDRPQHDFQPWRSPAAKTLRSWSSTGSRIRSRATCCTPT